MRGSGGAKSGLVELDGEVEVLEDEMEVVFGAGGGEIEAGESET